MEDAALDWDWVPPLPDNARSALEVELADLERQIEVGAEEMNTLEGMERLERLEEERDGVLEEMTMLYPTPELLEADSTLVDARFLNQDVLDAEGNVAGYTVQAIMLYQDTDNEMTGVVLDVGHYADKAAAAETYDALQESLTRGSIGVNEVSQLAEAMAEENGLDKGDWHKMTVADLARYEYQRMAIADVPVPDPPFDTQIVPNPETTVQEQAALANGQALTALRGIGLEAPSDFDLRLDSFYDPATGERVINGVFQADPNDPTQNCRPLLVSLTGGQDGFQAQALEFGATGSLAQVRREHEHVQDALEAGGIEQAVQAIADIETIRLEPASAMSEIKSRSLDIA
jgi:hypothetical protein